MARVGYGKGVFQCEQSAKSFGELVQVTVHIT